MNIYCFLAYFLLALAFLESARAGRDITLAKGGIPEGEEPSPSAEIRVGFPGGGPEGTTRIFTEPSLGIPETGEGFPGGPGTISGVTSGTSQEIPGIGGGFTGTDLPGGPEVPLRKKRGGRKGRPPHHKPPQPEPELPAPAPAPPVEPTDIIGGPPRHTNFNPVSKPDQPRELKDGGNSEGHVEPTDIIGGPPQHTKFNPVSEPDPDGGK